MSEIPKAYEPQSVEDKWYDFWLKQGCFTADPARVTDQRPAYSIVIPPPNVTGVLHMGHALNNTLQDIIVRFKRMQGYNTLWMPGMDHAGIATQMVVERQLAEQGGPGRRDMGREAFVNRVWEWKAESGGADAGCVRGGGSCVSFDQCCSKSCAGGRCAINGGSWDHDTCCYANPGGYACAGGAASCVASLKAQSSNRVVTLATTTFQVAP